MSFVVTSRSTQSIDVAIHSLAPPPGGLPTTPRSLRAYASREIETIVSQANLTSPASKYQVQAAALGPNASLRVDVSHVDSGETRSRNAKSTLEQIRLELDELRADLKKQGEAHAQEAETRRADQEKQEKKHAQEAETRRADQEKQEKIDLAYEVTKGLCDALNHRYRSQYPPLTLIELQSLTRCGYDMPTKILFATAPQRVVKLATYVQSAENRSMIIRIGAALRAAIPAETVDDMIQVQAFYSGYARARNSAHHPDISAQTAEEWLNKKLEKKMAQAARLRSWIPFVLDRWGTGPRFLPQEEYAGEDEDANDDNDNDKGDGGDGGGPKKRPLAYDGSEMSPKRTRIEGA
ncbi:hypothetical protein B0H17DRAFT_495687 [Mycena rosella]|uniref:Uncharacterized protein n=1 Tax=Mycena rosella TaxID=1033263 RepID=A0AAD7C2V5_MYCRO|nr:hypothetical protein B0H17DRAFT_495687 [Mycena rosella]